MLDTLRRVEKSHNYFSHPRLCLEHGISPLYFYGIKSFSSKFIYSKWALESFCVSFKFTLAIFMADPGEA